MHREMYWVQHQRFKVWQNSREHMVQSMAGRISGHKPHLQQSVFTQMFCESLRNIIRPFTVGSKHCNDGSSPPANCDNPPNAFTVFESSLFSQFLFDIEGFLPQYSQANTESAINRDADVFFVGHTFRID